MTCFGYKPGVPRLAALTNEKCYVLTWEFKATELHLSKLREILFEGSGSSSHTVHASIWKTIQLRCNLLSWEFLAWNKPPQGSLWDFFPTPCFCIQYKLSQASPTVLSITKINQYLASISIWEKQSWVNHLVL